MTDAIKSGLDEQLVRKLAKLARLALDDAAVAALVPELSGIVAHVNALQAIDTTGVPPMTHGAPLSSPVTAGIEGNTQPSTELLGRTAIAQSAGYDDDDGTVKVPRVVD